MDDEKLLHHLASIEAGQTWTLAVLGALVTGLEDFPLRVQKEYQRLTQPPAEAGQPAPEDNGSGTKENE